MSNPTTATYWGRTLDVLRSVYFTEDTGNNFSSDELIEKTLRSSPILLDTPSQFFRAFFHAFIEGGLKDTALELEIEFIFFYVCTPDDQVLEQFINILQRLKTKPIRWVLVKNLFRTNKEEWKQVLSNKTISSTLKKYQVVEMFLPELKRPEITMIERQKLSFPEAITQCPTLVGKTRLHRYQKVCDAEFARVFLELIKLHEQ